jgi:hypothetical protein
VGDPVDQKTDPLALETQVLMQHAGFPGRIPD